MRRISLGPPPAGSDRARAQGIQYFSRIHRPIGASPSTSVRSWFSSWVNMTVSPLVPYLHPACYPEQSQQGQHALARSEEHTSELQSLMRISYAVFCLKKKKQTMTQEIAQVTQHRYPTIKSH